MAANVNFPIFAIEDLLFEKNISPTPHNAKLAAYINKNIFEKIELILFFIVSSINFPLLNFIKIVY